MICVAIDGPAGVGKSTTAKALATKYDFAYLDTGAMYRAATLWCMNQGIRFDKTSTDAHPTNDNAAALFEATNLAIIDAVRHCFDEEHLEIIVDPKQSAYLLDGQDVTDQLHDAELSANVGTVSRILEVRDILIAAQRAYIGVEAYPQSFSSGRGIVVEGRDITTVVAPDAEVKVLLTARPEVRQERRNCQQHSTSDNVVERDTLDSKVTNFMTAAQGVVTIDNSDLTFDEVLDHLSTMVDEALERQEEESWMHNLDEYELQEDDEALLSQDHSPQAQDHAEALPVLAIIGRPNVGKSTLVNRILGRRAAVVEDTPGVTRDRISYDAQWSGTNFKLVDTGGWEADVEGIESAIADQASIAMSLADAILFVVDAQTGLTSTDERIVKLLRASRRPVTLAVNKIDAFSSEYMSAEFWKLGLGEPYSISALHGRGIGDLLDVAINSLKTAGTKSAKSTPSSLRKIALTGKPNVGKSSLLNYLYGQQRSVVDDLAGTTRDPVDEIVRIDNQDWLFIDTAGIKRRSHKLSGAEYYSLLRTQAAIERSELALVLFDASLPISDQDLRVMSAAADAGKAIVLVFNKWDLMDDFARERMERLWQTEFSRITWARRVNLSAKTGWHTNRLVDAMREALASWDKRIPTGKLNAFLGRLQASHPHPLRGGKQPRMLFATQAATQPPRFVIFSTGFLEHGYCRYIERRLREEFGFEGSPIQLSIRIREKRKK